MSVDVEIGTSDREPFCGEKTLIFNLRTQCSLLLLARRGLNFEFRKLNLNNFEFEFELGSSCKHAYRQATNNHLNLSTHNSS